MPKMFSWLSKKFSTTTNLLLQLEDPTLASEKKPSLFAQVRNAVRIRLQIHNLSDKIDSAKERIQELNNRLMEVPPAMYREIFDEIDRTREIIKDSLQTMNQLMDNLRENLSIRRSAVNIISKAWTLLQRGINALRSDKFQVEDQLHELERKNTEEKQLDDDLAQLHDLIMTPSTPTTAPGKTQAEITPDTAPEAAPDIKPEHGPSSSDGRSMSSGAK